MEGSSAEQRAIGIGATAQEKGHLSQLLSTHVSQFVTLWLSVSE
jgi:hypothetical protein